MINVVFSIVVVVLCGIVLYLMYAMLFHTSSGDKIDQYLKRYRKLKDDDAELYRNDNLGW